MCLYMHGSPKTISAGSKTCLPVLKPFLYLHAIKKVNCLLRSSHKKSSVERNNGTTKEILKRWSPERTSTLPETVVSRSSLVTILLHESSTLSSFSLTRGSSTSILLFTASSARKISRRRIIRDIYIWTMQKALKPFINNRVSYNLPPNVLYLGRHHIYVTQVKFRRSAEGQKMKLTYDDIRLKLQGERTSDLGKMSLEAEVEDI